MTVTQAPKAIPTHILARLQRVAAVSGSRSRDGNHRDLSLIHI